MSLNTQSLKEDSILDRLIKDVILIALVCMAILSMFDNNYPHLREPDPNAERQYLLYNTTVERYYQMRKTWVTSNLGSILYKNQPHDYGQKNRTFEVLIYRHQYYNEQHFNDALRSCPVDNCKFTSNESILLNADAVVIMYSKSNDLPWLHKRNASQLWVLLTVESPISDVILYPSVIINNDQRRFLSMVENVAGLFNWTMTYRSDSDVPIPYGRVIPLPELMVKKMYNIPIKDYIPYWKYKQREVLAVVMISHCAIKKRLHYIYELQKYIQVDLFGRCAKTLAMKLGCPGHVHQDCKRLGNYLFYLSFENSNCRHYITEKVFHNAFTKGAIPVVMGAPVSDYEKLLPPHSFLHVKSFNSPRDLAIEMINLSNNDEYLFEYHQWRRYFMISNEHGTFGGLTCTFCRLCQALNYNDDATKIYDMDMLRLYFDPALICEVDSPFFTDNSSYIQSSKPKPRAKWKAPKKTCRLLP